MTRNIYAHTHHKVDGDREADVSIALVDACSEASNPNLGAHQCPYHDCLLLCYVSPAGVSFAVFLCCVCTLWSAFAVFHTRRVASPSWWW